MRIRTAKSNFLEAVQTASRAVSARSTLPILSGIFLRTSYGSEKQENKLLLCSTDLEISIKCEVDVTVQSPGSIVIPARLLNDIIRNLPEATIEMYLDSSNQLNIICGKSKFLIRVLSPEDFPRFPEIIPKDGFTTEPGILLNVIRQVIKSVSRDETRPVLTGVLVNIEGNKLKMVATDGYRLAVRVAETGFPYGSDDAENKKKLDVIIPARTLEELTKIISSHQDEVSEVGIEATENQIIFNLNLSTEAATDRKITLISRLIEGQFPNYQQLLPEGYELRLEIERDQFINALRRVSLLAQNNPVKLKIDDEQMKISAITYDVGEAMEEIEVKPCLPTGRNSGGGMEIAFNPQFLLDGLVSVGEEKIAFEMTSPIKPALLKPSGPENFLYLIMPVRLS
ncbi:MAG: DNA polymerase III subunit beta [Actinomycetota bacterium]|nr:DNA polymerase III subunit beta [Actinomycetota bacterium]MDI6821904.1 DNA polymerase III subunit beta [Actinomycetota bacterium]